MPAIPLVVNGEPREVDVDPATPLLTVLRNDLGLASPKFGCGLEQCGSCTVLVGAEPTQACGLPVGRVDGREITTLEGLGTPDSPHPLQRAFVEENAAQCGYCLSGMIMAAAGLLAWNAEPDDAEIRRALAPNLCRCGAHPRILAAVKRAARERAG